MGDLFIELTGTEMESLLLACSIVACDLADAGHEIHPVSVEYTADATSIRPAPCWNSV